MQILGYIFIVLGLADFGLSWMGINLTPFLPDTIARFSPIILGGVGVFCLNASKSSGENPEVPEKYKKKTKKK